MFNLVEETSQLRLENNLIRSGQIRDSWFSLGFNLVSLVLVLGSVFFFLYYLTEAGIEPTLFWL